jgi:SdrD B-like domain
MTPAQRAGRRAAWLCGLGLLAALEAPSYAQTTTPTPPATPPAFEDHYIAGGSLSPDVSSGDYSTSDTSGLARSIRIDGVVSVLNQQGPNAPPATHEDGFVMDAQWDTISYGAWSADAAARTSGSGPDEYGTATFSLHERALPFDGGWQADNALGDINTPLINLASVQPRFILTQAPMEGVDTVWRGPSGLELVAGAGEPGIYSGIRVPAFDGLGGSTGTLGAQWVPAPQWTLGGEFATARDTSLYYQPLVNAPYGVATSERISSTTSYLTAAWQDGPSRAQLNLIDGSVDGDGSSLGAWLDASRTSGAVTQSVGAFRIDPNLAWGNQLITSDVEGGYYRVDYQSRRWLADFDVDQVSSVSGSGYNTTFLTGDARYQLTRDTGVGGFLNLRHSDSDNAWSAEGYLDNGNSYGTGRGQLDYATAPQAQDASFTLQQTWNMPAGERLATTAAIDEIRSTTTENTIAGNLQQDSTVVRLAVYGGGDLTARLALNATVQWAAAVHGEAAPSRFADVSLTYQLARSWLVLADFYENRMGSWTPLVVTSPLTPPTPTVVPAAGERGVFLTVRYQASRGARFAPLGGVPGSGSGSLSGVVYLDANENGRYDAGETGAANVTVILDGRFSVHTDANGRFDFPAVAAGHHVLTVETENLPLPWTLTNSGRTEVNVSTRERTEVDIGALRLK